MRKSRISPGKQARLIEHVIVGTTVRPPSVRLSVASTELESRRGPTGVIDEVFARTQASGIGQAGAAPPADGQRRCRRGRHFPRDPLPLAPAGTPYWRPVPGCRHRSRGLNVTRQVHRGDGNRGAQRHTLLTNPNRCGARTSPGCPDRSAGRSPSCT